MKKITLVLMLAVTAVMQCNAQLLWKVSGNGLSKPSYLFGTFHVAPVSLADSIAGLDEAIKSVDAVYGELSLDDINAAKEQIAPLLMAPADSTINRLFTPAQLAEIDSAFSAIAGQPLSVTSMMNVYKPTMVSTVMLTMLAQKNIVGYVPGATLDAYVLGKGAAASKPVGGLEPLQKQIDLLYCMPIAEQASDLLDMIRVPGGAEKLLLKMTDVYKAGDLDALYDIINDPDAGGLSDSRQGSLLNQRNEAWVEFLLGFIPTTSVLVVCGAGHLPGANGLISRLRGAGYSVEPVN